jgi:preprotein translocase subunit SecE
VRKVIQFFKDSYAELKKVQWPSQQEVGSSTRVVLISVVIFAAVLGLVDFVLVSAIEVVF